MDRKFGNQLHRSAVSGAKPLPIAGETLQEMLRSVRESRIQRIAVQRRNAPRLDVEDFRGVLTVIHPGGSIAAAECIVIDLSTTGAGILYPGFLYGHTECGLHISTIDGEPMVLPATVMWCRFVSKSIHSLGVRFVEPIDLKNFVPAQQWAHQLAGTEAAPGQPEVTGRLLMVGFDTVEQHMVRHFLRKVCPDMEWAGFEGAALDRARQESFDLILIDADDTDSGGGELVTKLRRDGCTEPIIAMTQCSTTAKQLDHLPDVEVLTKPLQQEMLTAMVRETLNSQSDPLAGTKPIRSSLPDLSEMGGAVSTYIEHCRKHDAVLLNAISADNAEEALRIAQSIRNTAVGFGFPALGEAASRAITAINASGSAKEAANHIRVLSRTIARLDDPTAQWSAA